MLRDSTLVGESRHLQEPVLQVELTLLALRWLLEL